jgi:micrococcal nuclease
MTDSSSGRPVTVGRTARRFTPRRIAVGGVALFVGLAVLGSSDPTDSGSPTTSTTPTAQITDAPVPTTALSTQAPEPTLGPTGQTQVGTVVRIVDGDTIRVQIDGLEVPVRYIGMNAPELNATDPGLKRLAEAATAANAALVEGRDVILERDVSDTDVFGRLLRNVWMTDGVPLLINLELVRQGYAQVSTYPPDVKYVELLTEAQESARTVKTGLWAAAPTPTLTPAPAPTATPAPTPPPIVAIDDRPRSIVSEERYQFEGRAGSYTWSTLAIEDDRITVGWSASASSKGDCRISWQIKPASGDVIKSSVRVEAGESKTGSRRFDTPSLDAAFTVDSTCGRWRMSMQGYVAPTPTPVSGGGGGGASCHPSYRGACLKVGSGDYDCQGGSGNGPNYVGQVSVVGYDEFDLDRDNDGVGCE